MPTEENIVFYRITHKRYQDDPFSGAGGLHYSSRWASKGQRVSYAADHLATATLEKIAGVQRADLLSEMVFVRAEIDAGYAQVLPESDLPGDWNQLPAPASTRRVGDSWLEEKASVVLRVPSVILPHSHNYVINADHPDLSKLNVIETMPLLLNNRILTQVGASLE